MEPIERIKIKSDLILGWIGLLGLLGTISFGLMQYINHKEGQLDDKKKSAFSLVEIYNKDPIIEARESLGNISHDIIYNAKSSVDGIHSLQGVHKIYYDSLASSVTEATENHETREALTKVVNFFDQAKLCIESLLCDEKVLQKSLHEEAYSYWFIFQSYIEENKVFRPSFGDGIEHFLKSGSIDVAYDIQGSLLTVSQIGLLLDIVGFVIVFFFGGFSFGIDFIVTGKPSPYVLPCKVIGFILIIVGFILQIFGVSL